MEPQVIIAPLMFISVSAGLYSLKNGAFAHVCFCVLVEWCLLLGTPMSLEDMGQGAVNSAHQHE